MRFSAIKDNTALKDKSTKTHRCTYQGSFMLHMLLICPCVKAYSVANQLKISCGMWWVFLMN